MVHCGVREEGGREDEVCGLGLGFLRATGALAHTMHGPLQAALLYGAVSSFLASALWGNTDARAHAGPRSAGAVGRALADVLLVCARLCMGCMGAYVHVWKTRSSGEACLPTRLPPRPPTVKSAQGPKASGGSARPPFSLWA